MESDQPEDSKGSSNESEIHDQVNNDTGTARFYECMFCKQGFTTAQALGGHMNIHRRDRARIRQHVTPSKASNQPREDYAKPELLPLPISSHHSRNNPSYFQPSTSSINRNPHPYHTDDLRTQKPHPLSLFEDDGFTNLSLQIGPVGVNNKEDQKRRDGEEYELDLELRLGHDRP